jgi:hypothetical protein
MKDRNALAVALASLVGEEELTQAARDSGFLQRQRKVQVVTLFWTLVLGMQAMRLSSLCGLQRLYHELAGTVLASASFQERFTGPLVVWLRAVFERAAARLADGRPGLVGPLATFQEVTLIDSTVRRLHNALAARYPGNRTNHSPAAVKVNVRYDLRGGRIASATVAPETRSETRFLDPGASCAGQLLVFDLGFFKLQHFLRIHRNGGFFLTRLKEGSGAVVTAVHSVCRGNRIDPVGQKVKDLLPRLQREHIDAEVTYKVPKAGMRGRPAKDRKPHALKLRFVAVRNPKTGKYHTYLTNIPPEVASTHEIAEIYRLRWHVELLFAQLKSGAGLDAWPARKEPLALAGIYAALIAVLVNRRLLALLRDRLATAPTWAGRSIPTVRWARVFGAHARAILDIALGVRPEGSLLEVMLCEAIEPKRRNPRLEARWAP